MSMTEEEIKALIDDTPENSETIVEDESNKNNETILNEEDTKDNDETISVEKQIDDGIFPLPSSNEHKVVNQLNEVAEDTEEKASQIFDVLSFLLDQNEILKTNIDSSSDFINSQIELLENLSIKFPNIEMLKNNLDKAIDTKDNNIKLLDTIEEMNNRIFKAIELMQYHDINRQKIERVMSVIKKLAMYLNGIFVDDTGKDEVQIAKHISGDSEDIVNEDDIDNLISKFQ
jgi:hypothetical protein